MTAHFRVSCATLAAFALVGAAYADISYTVTAAEGQRLRVEMKFDTAGPVKVQMPNWAPGSYRLSFPAQNLQDFVAADGSGKAITVNKEGDNTWSLFASAGKVVVNYTMPFTLNAGAANYSGPSTYLYVMGRKTEPCRLTINVPQGWKIATGLDPVGKSGKEFKAPDYDVFADTPVTLGAIRELRYKTKGKDHLIALYGPAKDDVDADYIVKACKFVSDMETDFMRTVPYKRYVWHFNTSDRYDGAGGLEHLNSTQITLASGVGPRTVSVLSHEFFHLWNVKRIRSKPLGPFDYTQLPQTGALWWLEGVTDYYASTLLYRYQWSSPQEYKADILRNLRGQRSRPGRLEVSPYQASYRVREAANGRGNSDGYQVSYYNTGWLVGMCLDIELRVQSKGKKSLDDVEYALWNLCKDSKPGFEEDEIRKQCVRLGGAAMGDFYDRVVIKPGELPIEEQLAKVGLKLVTEKTNAADLLINLGPAKDKKALLVRGSRGAAETLVKANDLVLSVNGVDTTGSTDAVLQKKLAAVVDSVKAGQNVVLKINRDGAISEVTYAAASRETETQSIVEDPAATAEQKRLRGLWMRTVSKR